MSTLFTFFAFPAIVSFLFIFFLTLTRHNHNLNHRVVFPWIAGAAQGKAAFFVGPLHYQQKEAGMHLSIPCPNNIRKIPENFAWIDRRLRTKLFLGNLSFPELALYLFLILAADKRGVSYYSSGKIAALFDYRMQPVDVIRSRNTLFDKGMIGFMPYKNNANEGIYQVLPLPKSIQPLIPCQRGGDISSLGDIIQSLENVPTSGE
ncbi:hypothetical protein DRN98_03800 [Methanosarcinales archaeon]|nr:MAG: hypothetical protein DRN98_03800 [Methanosarcinales archaeon]